MNIPSTITTFEDLLDDMIGKGIPLNKNQIFDPAAAYRAPDVAGDDIY